MVVCGSLAEGNSLGPQENLKLVERKRYPNGVVQLNYLRG